MPSVLALVCYADKAKHRDASHMQQRERVWLNYHPLQHLGCWQMHKCWHKSSQEHDRQAPHMVSMSRYMTFTPSRASRSSMRCL